MVVYCLILLQIYNTSTVNNFVTLIDNADSSGKILETHLFGSNYRQNC